MSDANKQKSFAALRLAIDTSDAAIASISSHKVGDLTLSSTDQLVLRRDLLSLLSLIQNSTTKISLALKPSSPTYAASLTPLKDLVTQITAIAHCVRLHNHDQGITFIQEVQSVVSDVIQSVRALCQTLLDIDVDNTRTSTGQAGDEYMVRTGAIHDLINKAKAQDGLSADNVSAVCKKLSEDYASLEDALNEVYELTNDTENPSYEDTDEMDDDGWGLLGVKPKKMNAVERARTKKVHTILRLSTLLHKNITQTVLSTNPQSSVIPPPDTAKRLDALPPQSSALLAASDDLVSALYAPQDQRHLATELSSFLGIIHQLRSSLAEINQSYPSFIEQMAQMSLQGNIPEDLKKRLNTCFDQVEKAGASLRMTLDSDVEI